MDDLTGKVAFVAGASRGIGRAIAHAIANAGAKIANNYWHCDDEGKEMFLQIRRFGHLAVAVKADVSTSAGVVRMIGIIEIEHGSPSIPMNNAGIGVVHSVDAKAKTNCNDTIAANLISSLLSTEAALPGMRALKWSCTINFSSAADQIGELSVLISPPRKRVSWD